MGVVVAVTTGLVIWLVLWAAVQIKSFDAFMLTVLIAAIAAMVHIALGYLPRGRRR
jgi:hypothetical protein